MAHEARKRTLYRDPKQALLGGVCAGIAEHLDVDIILVRVAALVALVMTCGLAIVVYLLLWTALPTKVSQGAFIEVVPQRVQSERYATVVGVKRDVARDHEDAFDEGFSQRAFRPHKEKERLATYRLPFALFVFVAIVVTLVIALVSSFSQEVTLGSLLPLYFIPLGILLAMLPTSSCARSIRICIVLLCSEACVLFLSFTLGFANYESLGLFQPSTFIAWLVVFVVLFAAIIFENATCYLLVTILLFMAITVSFYDFGFFGSVVMPTRS